MGGQGVGLTVRARFAPSPTGDLHIGGAWSALASWITARAAGGDTLLRVEDLDTPRVVAGSERRIEEDLRWLGLDWDEPPVRQSERRDRYRHAVARLAPMGLVYPCDCSRAEIARVASAPHAGDEVVYPGICRDKDPSRAMRRAPSLRVRVPDVVVAYEDAVAGHVEQNLERDVGDFVLQRGDGVFAYQLAVVVDDLEMRITDVVRGADLIASTPRQIWLARTLGGSSPRYAHVPLVLADDGARLEKRTARSSVRELRDAGVQAERIVGWLAHGLGLAADAAPRSARDIAREWAGREIRWASASPRLPVHW